VVEIWSIDSQAGLLREAAQRPSPHHDDRPAGAQVDTIVIHGISLPPGEFGSDAIEHFFCGRREHLVHPAFASLLEMRVSAHLLIKRTGDVIQFVPFTKRAWHAGESFFAGRTQCNDFSVGIELEGTDDIPYEKDQYRALSGIIISLIQAYPHITQDRIVGHADIAPQRKKDPGPAFDWAYLKGMLA
jgi:AmpD protein